MKLIDVDAFAKRVLPMCKYPDVLKHEIEQEPTVDPVKHGEWMNLATDNSSGFCSLCECPVDFPLYLKMNSRGTEYIPYDFCPYCGARMD